MLFELLEPLPSCLAEASQHREIAHTTGIGLFILSTHSATDDIFDACDEFLMKMKEANHRFIRVCNYVSLVLFFL